MTFSDYYTPHSKVTIVFKRFHYQRLWVTPDVNVMITLEKFILIDTQAWVARGNGIVARILHQLSPRLLAEPWRLKGGAWERVGMRVNAVCFQQFHQFIQLVRTCISTRRDQSGDRLYILLQCHRYTESPLCSLLETANRPDAAIACSLT